MKLVLQVKKRKIGWYPSTFPAPVNIIPTKVERNKTKAKKNQKR